MIPDWILATIQVVCVAIMFVVAIYLLVTIPSRTRHLMKAAKDKDNSIIDRYLEDNNLPPRVPSTKE